MPVEMFEPRKPLSPQSAWSIHANRQDREAPPEREGSAKVTAVIEALTLELGTLRCIT